jgi:hypothetical protein
MGDLSRRICHKLVGYGGGLGSVASDFAGSLASEEVGSLLWRKRIEEISFHMVK